MARGSGAEKIKALGYLRTSSAANCGADRDSEVRQRLAIERYAKAAGIQVVGWFTDPGVSGADPVETRAGFAAMLDRIEGNGVRLVLVEDASRFARSVIAQELGVLLMVRRGVRVVTANGDDMTATDDPARVMMRQVAGAFAEYEKARLVAKLKGARDRKSAAMGRRCEGRKGYVTTQPELVREAKRLHRKSPVTGQRRSLRAIAVELARLGYANGKGQPFAATQVMRLVAGPGRRSGLPTSAGQPSPPGAASAFLLYGLRGEAKNTKAVLSSRALSMRVIAALASSSENAISL